jgi:4-amino-4-deoxy-L-arabinose transferase-like glycosyltransferase
MAVITAPSKSILPPALPLILLLLAALGLGFFNLTGNLMNDDEGAYLYSAWRVSEGETPYRDFNLVQTPLAFWIMAAVFKIAGPSVAAARAVSFLFALGAALFLYAAARRAFGVGRPAAATAAFLFLFTKHIFYLGRSFMPDDIMIFLGAAALFLALRAEDPSLSPRRRIAAALLAGTSAGLASLAKLNGSLVFAGYAGYLLWTWIRRKEPAGQVGRRLAAAGTGFAAAFILPMAILMATVPHAGFLMLGFHAGRQTSSEAFTLATPFVRLVRFVGSHNYGLVPVAVLGLAAGRFAKDSRRFLLALSAAAPLVFLFLPGRFFIRYAVFALAPLAVFCAVGLEMLWRRRTLRIFALPPAVILITLSLGPSFNPKTLAVHDQGTRNLVALVEAETKPGDFVFGDDPFINFLARRPCPPALVDVSEAWTKGGLVTADIIREKCEGAGVKLIFVETGRSAHHLVNLRDFDRFQVYLDEKYRPALRMKREFLDVAVYIRN